MSTESNRNGAIIVFVGLALLAGFYLRTTTVEKVKTVVETAQVTLPDGICMDVDVDKDGAEIMRRVACEADLPHVLILKGLSGGVATTTLPSLAVCKDIAAKWRAGSSSHNADCYPIKYY